MKDFKGTKGEWEAHLNGGLSSVKTSAGVKLSLMIGSEKYYNEDERDPKQESWIFFRERTKPLRDKEEKESEANAKLIAAAPDLLEVCWWIVNDFEGDYMLDGEIIDKPDEAIIDRYYEAKKAIKKALGE